MTDKKKEQTEAGATELTEHELDEAQGGITFTAPGDVAGIKQGKKANKPGQVFDNQAGADRTAN